MREIGKHQCASDVSHPFRPRVPSCTVLVSAFLALSLHLEVLMAETHPVWRGGIGITFGEPARKIPDITELGYEIIWGDEHLPCVKALDLAVFRYWNSIVETSLRDPGGRYDFSQLEDKQKAAQLAFDAWAESQYGVKGLSKYAKVRHNPGGAYGDVFGSMDLSSENPLVKAVVQTYLDWFREKGITRGGIALDNAAGVPEPFLQALKRQLNALGLGIATNGCPDHYLPYIDFFGNEGFPFSPESAKRARSKGFRGIFGEFALRQISSGDLESYLKTKPFYGIVFFGYTDGGRAAGAQYSFYYCRPDVYDHQRWVFRKYIPLSRAVCAAAVKEPAHASLLSPNPHGAQMATARATITAKIDRDGKVDELASPQPLRRAKPSTQIGDLWRYGDDISKGVYFYVSTGRTTSVVCDSRKLGLDSSTLAFEEFSERLLAVERTDGRLEFRAPKGQSLIQLGSAEVIARNILGRTKAMLEQQLVQRKIDRDIGMARPLDPWACFCRGYALDKEVTRSGKASMRTVGGKHDTYGGRWKYHDRQGAAQFVVLNQDEPTPLTLRGWSKAKDVPKSDFKAITNRRHHFSVRLGHIYCMHLYLDYQDGRWPEVHTAAFSAGTHDWEEKVLIVTPKRPVRTAMVLLELHQPSGTAWFDDIHLAEGTALNTNLLAYPGFEADDFDADQLRSLGRTYERKVESLVQAIVKSAAKGPTSRQLARLSKKLASLSELISEEGLDRLWSREMRDIDDAQRKLGLCSELVH